MEALTLNDALSGFTVLLQLAFAALDEASTYRLPLELAESESVGSSAISVTFDDVSNLCLSEFGGGLTQLLHLRIVDIRDRQWDRSKFEVSEVERQVISFRCRSIGAIGRYSVGSDSPPSGLER